MTDSLPQMLEVTGIRRATSTSLNDETTSIELTLSRTPTKREIETSNLKADAVIADFPDGDVADVTKGKTRSAPDQRPILRLRKRASVVVLDVDPVYNHGGFGQNSRSAFEDRIHRVIGLVDEISRAALEADKRAAGIESRIEQVFNESFRLGPS